MSQNIKVTEQLKRLYFFVSDFLVTLAIAGAIFVFVYFALFRPYQVKGRSMFDTFVDGQYVLTDVLTRHFSQFHRGDVLVFQSPTEDDKDFIKRIIGEPGDTVGLEGGHYIINGKVLDESEYIPADMYTSGGPFLQEGQSIKVPEGEYFVSGDNRPYSSDSREWGFITQGEIIGRSLVVYWPISDFWVVEHPKYPNS